MPIRDFWVFIHKDSEFHFKPDIINRLDDYYLRILALLSSTEESL